MATLLDQIEHDALDSRTRLADALRKCIALGDQANSAELREWAGRELRGYERPEDLPSYRQVVAPIAIDRVAGPNLIKHEQISALILPEVARNRGVSEDLPLVAGVGELQHAVEDAEGRGETVRLGLPHGAETAYLMTLERGSPYNVVQRVYRDVSPATIRGVLDQVRTRLVELVAEVRATTADPNRPTAADVQTAVNVVFHADARDVTINPSQVAAGETAAVRPAERSVRPWWRTTKAIWSFAVGAATILAGVTGYLVWVHTHDAPASRFPFSSGAILADRRGDHPRVGDRCSGQLRRGA